jgi:hypothetical protein
MNTLDSKFHEQYAQEYKVSLCFFYYLWLTKKIVQFFNQNRLNRLQRA